MRNQAIQFSNQVQKEEESLTLTKIHPQAAIMSSTGISLQRLLRKGNKTLISSSKNLDSVSLKQDLNKWKRFLNKISKMTILLRKSKKDIKSNKREKISNLLLILRINKIGLLVKIRNKSQDQVRIMMDKKIIGTKEHTISYLRIFDINFF